MNTKKQNKLVIDDKEYIGSGHVRIYVDHQQICKNTLKQLNDNNITHYQYILPVMVFTALALEAYLNHIGKVLFRKDWDKIERTSSPYTKLILIKEKLSMEININVKPFSLFNAIFKYRNMIVHGKTEYIDKPTHTNIEALPVQFTTKWEDMTTLANANKFYEAMVAIIKSIHEVQTTSFRCKRICSLAHQKN